MQEEKILYMSRKEFKEYLKDGLKGDEILIIEAESEENIKEDRNGRKETECGADKVNR